MRQLKPGTPRIIGWGASFVGGSWLVLEKSASKNLQAIGAGLVTGGLWSMFVKT